MEWREEGVILTVRKHSENSAIVTVMTAEHGRHAGVVRGATSRKMSPILQPGAQVEASWRARLEEHIGSFTIEPVRSRTTAVMSDRVAMAGLNAVCALLDFSLAERDPHPDLYDRTIALLDALGHEDWAKAYIGWELALLDELGFGLDLSSCAVTGTTEELKYVSPKSGRTVSAQGAGEWANRLLTLPRFLGGAAEDDLGEGLRLAGHFMNVWLAPEMGGKPVPAARERLVDLVLRKRN